MHVTLPASSSAVLTERLLQGKLQQEMFHVVDGEGVVSITDPGTLL